MTDPPPGRTPDPHATWTAMTTTRPDARVRLYCFPFMGSPAAFHTPLARALPGFVETCSLQSPGPGSRAGEPPADAVTAVASELAGVIGARTEAQGVPAAFFGHCSGALLAFETARALVRQGRPGPVLLAVSAAFPPRLWAHRMSGMRTMSGTALLTLLTELAGHRPLHTASVMALAKQEALAYLSFEWREEAPLDCPLAVFGGLADPVVPPAHLDGWDGHTTGRTTTRLYPGRHFYLLDHWARVARDLGGELAAALP
ncbi:thioesterase II family protein [Streptomyces specialis]|uniref:thioesterase II family protein n=1 Tax=Streptomyces specialis TaxID=498367 RepID=UPI00073EA90C|nr:thioesterase domain-containing protein [Streptomyces specialis]